MIFTLLCTNSGAYIHTKEAKGLILNVKASLKTELQILAALNRTIYATD